MKSRIIEAAIVVLGLGVLIVLAIADAAAPVSTYSTFDTGPNGYQALFNVLSTEGVTVERLQEPLDLRDARVRTIAFTSTQPERASGTVLIYDKNDYQRLSAFQKSGGKLVYFASPESDPMRAEIKRRKLHVTVLDATRFTNLALSQKPQSIRAAYNVLAGSGVVAFDERLHGYAVDRTMWSVLPWPVHAAVWIVILAIVLVLVDANVRFAPPLAREAVPDRDSAAYIASMAALLRRARAGRAAIARFAKNAPDERELQALAQLSHPGDAAVLRAAVLASHHRKEGV